MSYDEIRELVQDRHDMDFLNGYRWALSLYAERVSDLVASWEEHRVIVSLDGRDTAGKWSNIKRIWEYFETTQWDDITKGIPTAEEKQWTNWFKRYANDFPKNWETIFYDRSWYNRAFVEPAMWFCTQEEYEWFMENVNDFEKNQIINEWIHFIKVYLSIWKETQKERLHKRKWVMRSRKSSKIDELAQEKWNYYTRAKLKVLELTDSEHAPWTIIDSTEKFLSASEIIKKIILTSQEVAQIVESTLSIDLSPNTNVVRNWKQELARMKKVWDIGKAKGEFKFARPTLDETNKIAASKQ